MKRKFLKLDIEIYQNFYQRGNTLDPISAWNRVRLRLVDIMKHAELMGKMKYRFLGFVKCLGLSMQIAKKGKSVNVLFKGIRLTCRLFF